MRTFDYIDRLEREHILERCEFIELLDGYSPELVDYLFEKSHKQAQKFFGNKVYVRGLIEFTNYCKNNCYYCGIRLGNKNVLRYRLTKEEILECCEIGYDLGFRTFVLQGGEDPYFTDDRLADIVAEMRKGYPDCAITLSVGERSRQAYEKFFAAGANRFLLRHETATKSHYDLLHPDNLSLENRKRCLWNLKEIGYQVGTGFMVGSPYQTNEHIAEDLMFISQLQPQMVGIGPFLPHHDTPFKNMAKGSMEKTLFLLGILRLMIPNGLIPATTALGTIDPMGREKGVLAGANVVMPNLSPLSVRKQYELYDNKICTGDEAAECRNSLEKQMQLIGYEIVTARGDFSPIK